MKIRIGWLVVLALFIAIGVYVYKFFNDGESIYKKSNYEFKMNIDDLAKIDDEIYIKYKTVEENSNELIAKLVVIHNPYINTIKLSSLNSEEIEIKKTNYKIKLVKFDTETNEITITVLNEEEK